MKIEKVIILHHLVTFVLLNLILDETLFIYLNMVEDVRLILSSTVYLKMLCDDLDYVKNSPAYLCTNTVVIPRDLAMAQACCPPAPPKHANACLAVS